MTPIELTVAEASAALVRGLGPQVPHGIAVDVVYLVQAGTVVGVRVEWRRPRPNLRVVT